MEHVLDESEIVEEGRYDGYYAVATNLSDPAKNILGVSWKGYQVEDRSRIMKTSFDDRPVDHRLPEHIKAHFLICSTVLPIYRLMEAKLDEQRTHVTVNDSITTLKNMNVANVHDIEYMTLYSGSKVLDTLTQLTLLPLDRTHYRSKELNGIIKKF